MTKKGWEYGGSTPEQLNDLNTNRKQKEEKYLTEIMEELAPLLGEDFSLQLENGLSGKIIDIKHGPSREIIMRHGSINFRYQRVRYWGDYGPALGIQLSCHGDVGINRISRNYAFDFAANRMPKASLKKMATTLKNHMETIAQKYQERTDKEKRSTNHAAKIAKILTKNGFEVTVNRNAIIDIKDVARLAVSSSGIIQSTGRFESVPIKTNVINIVKIAKHIRSIKKLNIER